MNKITIVLIESSLKFVHRICSGKELAPKRREVVACITGYKIMWRVARPQWIKKQTYFN